MENTISLPKPDYKEKMTEFAKESNVYHTKKKKINSFDKLLDKVFLDKYFTINNLNKDNE